MDEQEWHPAGRDVPAWYFAAVMIGVAVAVLAVTVPTVIAGRPTPGPTVTPSTYGPPP